MQTGAPNPDAIVVTTLVVPSILLMTPLWLSATSTVPSGKTSRPCGAPKAALRAGPPSPEYPSRPIPASVSMRPSGVTIRMPWSYSAM